MRPRDKTKEIGPDLKFAAHLQQERLMDNLQASVGKTYLDEDVDGPLRKSNDKDLKTYLRTGEYFHMPGHHPEDFDDDNDYVNARKRE